MIDAKRNWANDVRHYGQRPPKRPLIHCINTFTVHTRAHAKNALECVSRDSLMWAWFEIEPVVSCVDREAISRPFESVVWIQSVSLIRPLLLLFAFAQRVVRINEFIRLSEAASRLAAFIKNIISIARLYYFFVYIENVQFDFSSRSSSSLCSCSFFRFARVPSPNGDFCLFFCSSSHFPLRLPLSQFCCCQFRRFIVACSRDVLDCSCILWWMILIILTLWTGERELPNCHANHAPSM